jgi:hypothetical protein
MKATGNTGSASKVAREVAEADFDRMCDAFRVDRDTSELDADDLKEWLAIREQIVRDMMRGLVIVGDDGRPTFTPPGSSKAFTFNKPTGGTLMALETHPGKQIGNMIAAMTDMLQLDRGELSKMDARDVQTLSRLAKVFLAER